MESQQIESDLDSEVFNIMGSSITVKNIQSLLNIIKKHEGEKLSDDSYDDIIENYFDDGNYAHTTTHYEDYESQIMRLCAYQVIKRDYEIEECWYIKEGNFDRNARKLPPLFGLAGWSGSGKTTLCTKLIENFTKIGINVGTLKHAHHKFDIDKQGKDSYNLRKAGARPMIISSKERFALIQENDQNDEKSLFEMLEIFSKHPINKCDIIIVEGYKNEAIPKLEVHRPVVGKPLLFQDDKNIFAIALEGYLETTIPSFDLNNINSITDFLIDKYKIS